MKVYIYPNFDKNNAYETTVNAVEILSNMNFGIYMDSIYKEKIVSNKIIFSDFESFVSEIDIIIVIGGDGTLLKASKFSAKYDKPLLGINTGKLGFMASIEKDDLNKLKLLSTGEYKVNKRNMLKICVNNSEEVNEYIALNDAVLSRMPISDLPEFSILSNSKEVSKIRADGIIFSTPTGSTAYALSAGGPIIEPDISCIEVTQICAHSLFSRPMIFSPDKKLSVKIKTADVDEISLLVDGCTVGSLNSHSEITISVSELYTKIIDINDSAFYKAIDEKLMTPIK